MLDKAKERMGISVGEAFRMKREIGFGHARIGRQPAIGNHDFSPSARAERRDLSDLERGVDATLGAEGADRRARGTTREEV